MTNASQMAHNLIGSEVLRIAAEINAMVAAGKSVFNFTVGDFDPRHFPIPSKLQTLIAEQLAKGQTNYPPSSGVAPLREAVAKFYADELGIQARASEVLIAGGARPLIYTIFTALLDPGDTVLYPVPSWNNNHYAHLARAESIKVACRAENGFMPTAQELLPHLPRARLLCLNSPLNPTGTVFAREALSEICDLVVRENESRRARGERPLFMMYDQIYWMNTHGGAVHHNPLSLDPRMAPYTIFVDGISKYFCATGLRVGWSLIPEALVGTFSALLGHVGAWAPKPEQLATAQFLSGREDVHAFVRDANGRLESRLLPLFEGIQKLKAEGLPVDAIQPQGGIYLSLRLQPRAGATNEELRGELLHEAGVAVVPFQAFGLSEDSGWFRMSVGAVARDDIGPAVEAIKRYLVKHRA